MKRVTRAVKPGDLPGLLNRPPRATLAFIRDGVIEAVPVAFCWKRGRYLVGLPVAMQPPTGRVKLLVDDGPWYFNLRGVWVRGTLVAASSPDRASIDVNWFELQPGKVAAWHYGKMREGPESDANPSVAAFLRHSLIARIATLSPARNPDIIPLYFVTYRKRIYMGTRAENPTVRDLVQNPEVVLLFHGEQAKHQEKVLCMRGRATFETTREIRLPVLARFALKYWLSPGGAWHMLLNARKLALDRRYKAERAGAGGLIEFDPQTWEFLTMPGPAVSDGGALPEEPMP